MSELTRRRFCLVTGAGLVAGACGSGSSNGDGGSFDLAVAHDLRPPADLTDPTCAVNGKLYAGPSSAFAVGSATFFACSRVFVARDAAGIYALTSICPHEQCDVSFVASNGDFECPCHQSTFDLNGGLTMGPATTSLIHYAVSLDGSGNVIVDLQTTVPASTRLQIQD